MADPSDISVRMWAWDHADQLVDRHVVDDVSLERDIQMVGLLADKLYRWAKEGTVVTPQGVGRTKEVPKGPRRRKSDVH